MSSAGCVLDAGKPVWEFAAPCFARCQLEVRIAGEAVAAPVAASCPAVVTTDRLITKATGARLGVVRGLSRSLIDFLIAKYDDEAEAPAVIPEPAHVRAGRKGGKARAAVLTAAERSVSARRAAQARWDKHAAG